MSQTRPTSSAPGCLSPALPTALVPARPKMQPLRTKTSSQEGQREADKKPIFRKASESFLGIDRPTPAPPPERTRDRALFPTPGRNQPRPGGPDCPSSAGERKRFSEGSGALDHGVRGGGVSLRATGNSLARDGAARPKEPPVRKAARASGAASLPRVVPPRSFSAPATGKRGCEPGRGGVPTPHSCCHPGNSARLPGPAAFPRGVAARARRQGAGAGEGSGAGSGAGISHRDSRAPPSAGAPHCARRGARGARLPGHGPGLSQG